MIRPRTAALSLVIVAAAAMVSGCSAQEPIAPPPMWEVGAAVIEWNAGSADPALIEPITEAAEDLETAQAYARDSEWAAWADALPQPLQEEAADVSADFDEGMLVAVGYDACALDVGLFAHGGGRLESVARPAADVCADGAPAVSIWFVEYGEIGAHGIDDVQFSGETRVLQP